MREASFFLGAGLVWGVLMAVLFPPFALTDEPAHFFRAYALADGQLAATYRPRDVSVLVPSSLRRLVSELGDGIRISRDSRLRPRQVLAALDEPLVPDRREYLDVRTAAQFPFVPYLPQAAGIACGRLFGCKPLLLFYCARLANLLVSSALIALAIGQMPTQRWFVAMAALTPMAASLRASVSADALTIAAAFLTVATVAKLAFGPEPRHIRRDHWTLALASIVLCSTKLPYAPLVASALAIPARRLPFGRRGAGLAALLAGAAAAVAWNVSTAMSLQLQIREGADRGRQIHDAVAEPLRALSIVAADAWSNAAKYLAQLVGIELGWLDTRLPWVLVLSYLALLAWLAMVDAGAGTAVGAAPRLLLAALTVAVAALVIVSQYATFTPFRASYVEGPQGRYFLPLVPAAALVLHTRLFSRSLSPRGTSCWAGTRHVQSDWAGPVQSIAALGAFVAGAAAATCLAIVSRFYD